jgi:hypothetical protein
MNFLQYHNVLRWFVVVAGIWAVLNALGGLISKREYSRGDNMSSLIFMISCDLQLLLGLILFVSNGWFARLKTGMGVVMKDPVSRFFTVEHALIMIIAWILVHIGRSSVKRADNDTAKHKRMLIYYGIAIFLILISIPWPFRQEVGRPWL